MLRNLLSHRLFIGILVLLICGVVSVYFLRTDLPEEPIKIYTPVEPLPKVEAPIGEPEQDGHVHEDGTWHEGSHEVHAPPAVSNTAPPGVATTPDFPPADPNKDPVEAAYKRLEYIKNNPYAWGGVHSERATELIAQLMPPTVANDHNEGEQILGRIEELIAQNDPRAGEVLITNMCEAGFIYAPAVDALEQIGPPAVPYVLSYVHENVEMSAIAVDVLGRLGVRYRADLGGIVDHIIIPKLEAIVADSDNARYSGAAVYFAQQSLEKLQ